MKPVLYADKSDDSRLFHSESNLDRCVDYVLNPEDAFCWITVGNISVYLKRTDEGVVVDLYPKGDEFSEPLASTYAYFAEAEPELDANQFQCEMCKGIFDIEDAIKLCKKDDIVCFGCDAKRLVKEQ